VTLGGGGLFLADPEPPAVGASLSVGFRPAKHLPHLQVKAEVRYLIPGKGMGIEFTDINPEYRQKLLAFIIRRMGSARKFPRAPLAAQVEYEGGSQIGFLRNISVGGVFIETKQMVATDTHLRIRFNLDDSGPIIIVRGEVRYAVAKIGMGVHFSDVPAGDQQRIAAYLAENGATAKPGAETSEKPTLAQPA
jgi:hypothetical protein